MSFDEDEVRRRLADAVSGLPFDPPDTSPLKAEGRRRRRNRRIVSATGGVALSVAVVAGVIAVGPGQSASPKPAPVLNQPSALPSSTVHPVTAPSSSPAPAVATSTVDPTAPVRLAYVNQTGVWVATLDPVTALEVGKPVHVSDTLQPGISIGDLQFSPLGRYLVWSETPNITPEGKTQHFGLFDGETGKHVTVAPFGPDRTGSVTATGTGATVVSGTDARAVDRNGVISTITLATPNEQRLDFAGGSGTGTASVVGTYPDGFLVDTGTGLMQLPADGKSSDAGTAVAIGDTFPTRVAADGTGTVVSTFSGADSCGTKVGTATWTVQHPDGTVDNVVFTKHPGRVTYSLSVSPDGVVGGVVADCKGATVGPTSFVELDGVIAHTTATNVTGAARGPHDIVAEVRGDGTTGDGHLRIYNASNQLVADLGGPAGDLTFAPEHLP